MALRNWSTSASGNASTVGINWAEGQPPSTVNDSAREMMAQVRRQYRPDEWAWVSISNTASVASQTSFRVSTDLTSVFHAQRRVRLQSASTTRYVSIVSSSFTAETTVTVTVDAGSLSASHSIAALGPPVVNASARMDFLPLVGGTVTGPVVVANAAFPQVAIDNNTTDRGVAFRNAAGVLRGAVGYSSASNVIAVWRYDDAGAFLGAPLTIARASGDTTLANALTVGGLANFQNIVNLQGSYTAVFGNLSIAGGSGGFVPGILAHFRNGGFASALVETTGSGQQARIGLKSPGVEWIWYTNGAQMTFHQASIGADRLTIGTDGSVNVWGGPLYPRGGLYAINGISNYDIYWDGVSTIQVHDAGDYSFFTRALNTFGWAIGGSQVAYVQPDGIKSRTNAKAWVYANVTTIQDSHNVSSITYNSAGDYIVNFATALPSGNWALAVGAVHSDAPYLPGWAQGGHHSQFACTIQIRRAYQAAGLADTPWHAVWFSGGL